MMVNAKYFLSVVDIYRKHLDCCKSIHKASSSVQCAYDGAV